MKKEHRILLVVFRMVTTSNKEFDLKSSGNVPRCCLGLVPQ